VLIGWISRKKQKAKMGKKGRVGSIGGDLEERAVKKWASGH